MMAFDPNKPVQTRDGRKARIICTDRVSDLGYPIVAAVLDQGMPAEELHTYNIYGACAHGSSLDLINIPVKREGWVNVYPSISNSSDRVPARLIGPFVSKGAADVNGCHQRIACVRIEWSEEP